MEIALRRNEVGQHLQIGEPARIGLVGSVAADALEEIALRVVLLRLVETGCVDPACCAMKPSRNAGKKRSSFQREYDITQ